MDNESKENFTKIGTPVPVEGGKKKRAKTKRISLTPEMELRLERAITDPLTMTRLSLALKDDGLDMETDLRRYVVDTLEELNLDLMKRVKDVLEGNA